MEPKRKLNQKEQNKIVKKTHTGGILRGVGFSGGQAAILRSDGKYHTESLEDLEKQGIYAL